MTRHAETPAAETERGAADVQALARTLEEADHYAALGVARDASRAEIRAAYLQLARRHRTPSGTPSIDQLKEQILERLTLAWEVLGDAETRQRYDDELEGGEDPADRILRADEAFRSALALLESGEAAAAARALECAVDLHPDEAEFRAWLLWARWVAGSQDPGETAAAASGLERIVREEQGLEIARSLHDRIAGARSQG